ncbi:hypothetical protein PTSG_07710 [Salpingoeca rosetta]|uniref:2-C-methyl-D-erythritol 4-phosphate cytidylyltransferase n=1 Tax=Salpingoeca rosetta (strain ATCC 50818 / BSB-021) TaxID=946362 RepID=F2UHJ4_SALR5|nr:uncharacterized protein PTSG_07710 [Salpingoeca rosetta]EGD76593.1 hypothetical protein PTSG_07710 [Salpingoeca rosetta]|eukprot:XP_004991507.1 hypothetical protein PTSG_07710 [Salpingoeca rosetta]
MTKTGADGHGGAGGAGLEDGLARKRAKQQEDGGENGTEAVRRREEKNAGGTGNDGGNDGDEKRKDPRSRAEEDDDDGNGDDSMQDVREAQEQLHQETATTAASLKGVVIDVVLPAGGIGVRTGSVTPKQYWVLQGKPLLYYTISTMLAVPGVRRVVVPIAANCLEKSAGWLRDWRLEHEAERVLFVQGGASRHASIKRGLDAIHSKPSHPNVVVVHDAVRPFVDAKTVLNVAAAAAQHQAAGSVLPLVSTVIKPNADGFLEESLDRSQYRASQTPQAFSLEALMKAYESCSAHDIEHGTEVLHLVLKYAGVRAKLVDCQPNVWKVTYKQDLHAAEQLAAQRMRQVAIVFGGGRGIGRHVVKGFRERGMQVAVVARTEEEVAHVAKEYGCMAICADVGNSQHVDDAYAQVLAKYKRVDVVVNCAGVALLRSIAETTDEAWQNIMTSNLSGCFYSSRRALASMQEQVHGGVIINVGSSAAQGGREGQSAYAASKAGIACLTETLALEGKPHNVVAYCVVPRRTYTSMRTTMYPDEDASDCLAARDVAALIVSVAMAPNVLLSGQAFYAK